jgi:hypothetical protein
MKYSRLILPVLTLLLLSCKRDKVTTQTIHGQIYNPYTDSGMANITVYLKENGNTISHTTSSTNGEFSFNNAQIHSQDSYGLYVPSVSGIAGVGVGIEGFNIALDKNRISQYGVYTVVPHFYKLCHTSDITSSIVSPDSFYVSFTQKKIATSSLASNYTYSLATSSHAYPPGYSSCFGGYIMGLWNITIEKWKSGVHTTTYDSIYMSYGATKTYTIHW